MARYFDIHPANPQRRAIIPADYGWLAAVPGGTCSCVQMVQFCARPALCLGVLQAGPGGGYRRPLGTHRQ